MPSLTFKNTVEKSQKYKDKLKREKYIRMRKLTQDLKQALKANEESDQDIDKCLAKLFNEHFPGDYLYTTWTISNRPIELAQKGRKSEL